MAESGPGTTGGNYLGWLVAGVIGFILIILVANGNDKSTVATGAANAPGDNASVATADLPLTPQPPLPLDVSAAHRGYSQFQLVAAAHVPGSSEIFSRNCYEAVGKPVDWHQLDRCGAYDALAARWTELNEDTAGQDDLTYFQSEAAATRYLEGAAAGGLSGSDADQRWASIQQMALKAHLVSKTPDEEPANDTSITGNEDENTNVTAEGTDLNGTTTPED